jgi:N-carbamoylputrescine amidase
MTKKTPRRRSNRHVKSRTSSTIRIGLTQMACSPDVRANREKQARLIERAARDGAKIICTQELFASQYFCQGLGAIHCLTQQQPAVGPRLKLVKG